MPNVSITVVTTDPTTGKDELKTIDVEENQIIYDALEDKDIKLPHGCLAGSCGVCKIEIIEGQENIKEPSTIEKDTIDHITETLERNHGASFVKGKTIRLSCRARVLGDIKIKGLD